MNWKEHLINNFGADVVFSYKELRNIASKEGISGVQNYLWNNLNGFGITRQYSNLMALEFFYQDSFSLIKELKGVKVVLMP